MPDEQKGEYLAVFSEPWALTAVLNGYRAIAVGLDAAVLAHLRRADRPVRATR